VELSMILSVVTDGHQYIPTNVWQKIGVNMDTRPSYSCVPIL